MALPTNGGIVIHCFLAAWHAMRIVTSLARQFAFAPVKTFGLTQPVYGTHRLEFVVVAGTGRVIEEECGILDGFARHVGKRASGESFDLGGNTSTRSFKVALHANVHPQFRTQAGGIYDAAANLFHFCADASGGPHMVASGSVAPLAVDAFGQVASENRVAAGRFVPCRNSRNSVMAEHALVGDEAAGSGMIGIGTRRHGPGATGFVRIPTQGQLDESSGGRTMQIGPRMVARAQDVIHLQLFNVRFFSREADLPAPLIEIAIAADHCVVSIGQRVIEFVTFVISYRVGGSRTKERAAHTGLAVVVGNLPMTRGAHSGIDIFGLSVIRRGLHRIAHEGVSTEKEAPHRKHNFQGEPTRVKLSLSHATQWLIYNAERLPSVAATKSY